MSAAIIQLVIGCAVFVLLYGTLTALAFVYFERALKFRTAWLISIVAMSVGTFAIVVYFLVKPQLGLPKEVDGIATFVMLLLVGAFITRQSRKYGIEKKGWFGIGAKSIFGVLLINWLFIMLVVVVRWVMGY